jgi:NADH:ubiquinone oxidoreductase subunit
MNGGASMNDWLRKVVDEVDREFEELPDWKKTSYQKTINCTEEDRPRSSIREPKSQDR